MTNTTDAIKALAETAHADSPARPARRRKRRPVKRIARGTRVIWPPGLEALLGVSGPTRWRYERDKKLPPRDVHIGKRSGWRSETIEAFLMP
jgi:predicted DNA-binding transcriptional regulator AlpA